MPHENSHSLVDDEPQQASYNHKQLSQSDFPKEHWKKTGTVEGNTAMADDLASRHLAAQLGPEGSLGSESAENNATSLTQQRNLHIEDILGQLRRVTMQEPIMGEEPETGGVLGDLQETLLSELSSENFEDILGNLERQFGEDESNLARKASTLEQLVIRLLLDEMQELQTSSELKIINVDNVVMPP